MYVAWSDGSLQSVYAPSLVVQEHLVIEANHPIEAIRPVHDAGPAGRQHAGPNEVRLPAQPGGQLLIRLHPKSAFGNATTTAIRRREGRGRPPRRER